MALTGRMSRLTRSVDLLGGYQRLSTTLYLVLAAVLVTLWARAISIMYSGNALFGWVGGDFSQYLAQANALWSGDPSAIYNLDVMQKYHNLLAVYRRNPNRPREAEHVPYPPLFAWLMTPFTLIPPPVAFVLWTSLNVMAALWLAWRVTQFFAATERPWVALLLLSSMPIVLALTFGQFVLPLACAVAEFYLSLRAGRDFRAGLWLAVLAFKPQYGVLFGLVLLWKRRWKAMAGATLGLAVILVGSVLVAGLPTLLAYPSASTTDKSTFHSDHWKYMINWRSLILHIVPTISVESGLLLTLVLGTVTVLGVMAIWRGPWAPVSPRFPVQITLLLLATLLANYHSHVHGAALLALPLAAAVTSGDCSRFMRSAVLVGIIVPILPLVFMSDENLRQATRLFALALVAWYGMLVANGWTLSHRVAALPPNSKVEQ